MKKHFIQVSCWLALLLPVSLHGQISVVDQYIAEALANNLSLRSYRLTTLRQQSRAEQARKLWQPKVDLNASYLFAEGGRTIVFPVGDLFNPVYGTLNRLTASQTFPEDLENFSTQLTPNNFLDASLSVSKPILNSTIKYNILIQEALVGMGDLDRELAINEVKFQVKSAYYNWLKTVQGIKVLQENAGLLDEVMTFNQKLIKYDKATPDIISDVNYRMAHIESQINNLGEQQKVAQTLLNTLLNRSIEHSIDLDTSVINRVEVNTYNLTSSIESALASRPEFRKLDLSNSVNELNINRIQAGRHPSLSVRGAVGIQSEEFSFDDGGPLYTLGISLGWNLFDGGLRKRQIDEFEIAREEIQLAAELATQQITLEVAQAFYRLRALSTKLASEEAAIEAAEISYVSIRKKYENEKALLIELLTVQNQLTTSRLNRTLTTIDLLILKADLDRIIHGQ